MRFIIFDVNEQSNLLANTNNVWKIFTREEFRMNQNWTNTAAIITKIAINIVIILIFLMLESSQRILHLFQMAFEANWPIQDQYLWTLSSRVNFCTIIKIYLTGFLETKEKNCLFWSLCLKYLVSFFLYRSVLWLS